jgi:hypothetical protein
MGYEGLAKRSVTIPFAGGLDEGKDEYVLDSPNAALATHARFDTEGRVGKRFGAESLTSSGLPSSLNGDHNSLFDHAGKLGVWGPQGCFTRDELANVWTETNEHCPRPSRVLTDPLIRGNDSIKRSDIAVSDNLACVVWEDITEGSIRYAFFDVTADSTAKPRLVFGPREFPKTVTQAPRVFTINSGATFVIVAGNGTSGLGATLYVSSYDVSAANYTFGALTSLGFGTGGTFFSYDIATDGGANFTVAAVATTTTIFRRCDATGYLGVTQTAAAFQVLGVMWNAPLSRIVAIGRNPSTPEEVLLAHLPTSYGSAPTVVSLSAGITDADLQRGTICQANASGAMFACVADGPLSSTSTAPVLGNPDANSGGLMFNVSTAYAVTAEGYVRGLEPVGKAIYLDPSNGVEGVMVPLARRGELPPFPAEDHTAAFPARSLSPIGYLCRPIDDGDGALQVAECGRFLVDRCFENDETYHLSHTIARSDGELAFTATVLTDVGSRVGAVVSPGPDDAASVKTQIDLVRAIILNAPAAKYATAQSLRLAASGSGLTSFDGAALHDCTLPAPTTVRIGDDIATGRILETSAYGVGDLTRIKLCYRWVDAAGRVHRSAPSGELFQNTATLAGSDLTMDAPAVIFFPPFPSAPNNDRGSLYEVEVYQSADDDIYYLIAILRPAEYTPNPCFDYIQLTTSTDGYGPHQTFLYSGALAGLPAYLEAFPPAYFNEEIHNSASPPLLDLCSTQTRVWLLSAEARDEVWPSKPLVPGRAPEFSAELVTRIPHEGGECKAIAALDDKVVVFKERLVFALFGEPADALGASSSLQPARLISGDVGCSNANSVVEGPFGVAFQSERGIYVLSRGGEFSFVGAAVKDTMAGRTVLSAVLVPSQSEVRWALEALPDSSGEIVVWNYRVNAWSHWTSISQRHACLWRGAYTRFSGTAVRRETVDDWSIGNHGLTYSTPWIKLAGMQGFKRVWRATLLGRWYDGAVHVFIGYNYDDEFAEFRTWTTEELGALVSDDTGNRMQLAVRPARQKCESIRFAFVSATEEILDGEDGSPGRGAEFVSLQLDLGVKRGAYKSLSAAAKK